MTPPDKGVPKARGAASAASFLVAAGLQVSGYTSPAVALGLFVAAGLLGASVAVPYWSAHRARRRLRGPTTRPESPSPRRQDDPGYTLLLPWVDGATGQLVLTLQHARSRADGQTLTPVAWQCRLLPPGQTTPAVVDDRHDEHKPVPWKLVVAYPRDFTGAPGGVAPGRYEASWVTWTFSHHRPEKTGERELARRSFVVTADRRVEPATEVPTVR